MAREPVFGQRLGSSVFIPWVLFILFLYAVKYAKENLDVSEPDCFYLIVLYLIMAFMYMACVWVGQLKTMYRNFLRSARRRSVAFRFLPVIYVVGVGALVLSFYLIDFRRFVDGFLFQGKLAELVKFFGIVPGLLLLLMLFALQVLAAWRGGLR